MHTQVPDGKEPLLVNMDETSIRLHQSHGEGHLVHIAAVQKQSSRSLVQDVSRQALRGSLTLVAFICNDPSAQSALPQVLIVSRALMTERVAQQVSATLPPNVLLWRCAKAWVTSVVMVRLMALLRERLVSLQGRRQILLYFDAYRAHWTTQALRAMARSNFMYCLIPAKLTWVLQPLDSHIFGNFKHCLKVKCQMGQTLKANGKLDSLLLIKSVCDCIIEVLEGRPWLKAFEETGLIGSQAKVSKRVLAQLGMHSMPSVSNEMPKLQHLQVLFPAHAYIPIDSLFACFVRGVRSASLGQTDGDEQNADNTTGQPTSYRSRLRSSCMLQRPSAPASSSEPWQQTPATTTNEVAPVQRRRLPWARPLLGLTSPPQVWPSQ